MILIVGDIHGDWTSLNALIEQHRPDMILQCGDFGFWPSHIWRDPSKKLKPGSTHIHWIDGNHEDLKGLQALVESDKQAPSDDMANVIYQPPGSTLELPDGRIVLFVGGRSLWTTIRGNQIRTEVMVWPPCFTE